MTPKQVVTLDIKERKEVELRCECGSAIRLPLPLKNQLPREQKCLAYARTLWLENSPTWARIGDLLSAVREWSGLEQEILTVSFVLTELPK